MADIRLAVGVDIAASVDEMRKDLMKVAAALDKTPMKIKIGIDDSSLNKIKEELVEISNMSGNTPVTAPTGDFSNTANIRKSANAWKSYAKQLRDAKAAAEETKDVLNGITPTTSGGAATKGLKDQETALRQMKALAADVSKHLNSWTAAKGGKSSGAYSVLEKSKTDMAQYIQQLQAGEMTLEEFQQRLLGLKNTVGTANAEIKMAGEDTKTWDARIKTVIARIGTWVSGTYLLLRAARVIRQMVTNVVELDTAMTDLKKVTDESSATYNRFLDNATARATKLGATLKDIVSASADFARLGYNISESESLADAAITYKNVGEITDIKEATESIISTMQAFNVAPEEAMTIVDKFNEVGNNFAISSQGIGEALLRSASAMHAAGNTLDETVALATAANTVVQDPAKVGTALKTASMYLRAAKTEAEDAGEATDGMASSVSELRKEILSLTGHKVDIQVDEDTFKGTYQTLKEMSAVWGSLTDVSRANILELFGGKRNANVMSAILENFSVAENALQSSMDSVGSAIRENEKYLNSIEGRTKKFKAEFENFSRTLINGNLLKTVVSLGTSILEFINNIIDGLGGLTSAILVLGGAIAALNLESTIAMLTKFSAVITEFVGVKIASLASSTFVIGIQKLNYALQFLFLGNTKLAKSFALSMEAASVAATALIAAVGAAIMIYNRYQKVQEENRRATIEHANSVAEEASAFASAYANYKRYAGRTNLTSSEENAFKTAIENVTTALGDKTEALKGLTAGTKDYSEALDGLIRQELQGSLTSSKMARQAAKEGLNDAAMGSAFGLFNGKRGSSIYAGNVWDRIPGIAKAQLSKYQTGTTFSPHAQSEEDLVDYYYNIIAIQRELADVGDMDNKFYRESIRVTDELKDSVEAYVQQLYNVISVQYQINHGVPKTVDEFEKYRDYLINTMGNTFTFDDKDSSQLSKIIDSFLSLNDTFAEFLHETTDLSNINIENMVNLSGLENTAKSLNVLSDALKEYDESGRISISTLGSIKDEFSKVDGINEYIKKLTSANLSVSELNQVLNNLAIEKVKQKVLDGELSNATEEQIDLMLQEANILNHAEIAHDLMNQKKAQATIQAADNNDELIKYIGNLGAEADACGLATNALAKMIIKMMLLDDIKLDLRQQINQINKLREASDLAAMSIPTKAVTDVKNEAQTKPYADLGISPREGTGTNKDGSKMVGYSYKGKWYNDYKKAIRDAIGNATIKELGRTDTNPEFSRYDEKERKENAKKKADYQKDLAKKEKEFAKNMAEAWEKEYLERLKEDLEEHKRILDKYEQQLNLIDFNKTLYDETDYANHMDLLSDKFEVLQSQGEALEQEFQRVATTIPKSADEAQELANRIGELGTQIRDNVKATREVIVEIDKVRLSAISAVSENQLSNFERELDNYDKRLKILKAADGITGKYTGAFAFSSFAPSIDDFKETIEKQQKENNELIRLEQEKQDAINKIVEDAAIRQAEKNAKARAEERQKLQEDMEETRKDIQENIDKITDSVDKGESKIVSDTELFGSVMKDKVKQIGDDIYNTVEEKSNKVVGKIKSSVQEAIDELNKLDDVNSNNGAFGIDSVIGITHTTSNQKVYKSGKDYAGTTGTCVLYAKERSSEITGKNTAYSLYGNGSSFGKGTKYEIVNEKEFEKNLVPGAIVSYDISQGSYNGKYTYGHVRVVEGYDAKNQIVYYSENYTGNQVKAQSLDSFLNAPYASKGGKPKARAIIRYAQGTDGHPGGDALTGEYGRELGILPNGKIVIFGKHGAELVNMPIGTKVVPHNETEKILKHTGNIDGSKIKKYADGTGETIVVSEEDIKKGLVDAFKEALIGGDTSLIEDTAKKIIDGGVTDAIFEGFAEWQKGITDAIEAGNREAVQAIVHSEQSNEEKYNSYLKQQEIYAKAMGENSNVFKGMTDFLYDFIKKNQENFSKSNFNELISGLTSIDDNISKIADKAEDTLLAIREVNQNIIDARNEDSEQWISDRNFYNDWSKYADSKHPGLRYN